MHVCKRWCTVLLVSFSRLDSYLLLLPYSSHCHAASKQVRGVRYQETLGAREATGPIFNLTTVDTVTSIAT
jgi:hypothetical protein